MGEDSQGRRAWYVRDMMMAALLLTALAQAEGPADTWQWRARVGGEFDAQPHGVFDLGARRGPWSIELQTTALDLRFAPDLEGGRAWVAMRAEPGTAGLFFGRWSEGRPAPDLNLFAISAGVEGGAIGYLPYGLYGGAQGNVQLWSFLGPEHYPGGVPGLQPVVRGELVLGWWRPWIHLWMQAGVDWTTTVGTSPHLNAELVTNLPWIVRPRIEIRAGWSDNTDDVLKRRLGGLNPYVIPLAGAGWAEFWVEDYAAFRVGPEVGQDAWRASLVADLDWFDGVWAVGFAATGRYENRGRWVEAALGYAPWIDRPDSLAMAGWVRVGIDWGRGWGPRP